MAHGFIPSQVEGKEIFDELIGRSLLQIITDKGARPTYYYPSPRYAPRYARDELFSVSGYRVCKMHDLIHDLAQFVIGDECSTLPESNELKKISKRTRHFILNRDVEYDMSDHAPRARTALLVGRNFIGLSKLKLLRVLQLDCVSTSIECLHHLRYLNLSNTDISELPESICMLINLQTLNMNHCYCHTKLPMSIVYMNKYTIVKNAENKIGELKHWNLDGKLVLYGLHKVKNVDEAKEANMSSRQNINSLSFSWGWGASVENAEQVLEALKPHVFQHGLETDSNFKICMDGIKYIINNRIDNALSVDAEVAGHLRTARL
ncbi:putative disease resistance protein RGA1 [Dioscorea cayenensis subsp. rotundata]|uniref:Disease resistance protein RGA1 n=1 Tax=Dioscorea cayennensis subsp. rotundata TaxID=55577 RepID=A0AB40B034_DIOCR|nr:putative disease resistance protein RGA1 [Dioscorea cayenensis subsp. rotundata]